MTFNFGSMKLKHIQIDNRKKNGKMSDEDQVLSSEKKVGSNHIFLYRMIDRNHILQASSYKDYFSQ